MLRSLPNVTLTPHFAGTTVESTASMCFLAVEECRRLLRGEKPLHLVNPEVRDQAYASLAGVSLAPAVTWLLHGMPWRGRTLA